VNKIKPSPKVSVIMSVYNGERYLIAAMDSIWSQTFNDFEFIVIDDGSTDGTLEILKSYVDDRLCLIHNPTNLKLSKSLNKGIELARGEYIARMDADDISSPGRFAKQVVYLDNHPRIGVAGGWAKRITDSGRLIGEIKHETHSDFVKWELCFYCPIIHPSVMMRTNVVKALGGYSDTALFAEDYDLWRRLSCKTELVNIPEYVLLYREHSDSSSIKNQDSQKVLTSELRRLMLAEYIGKEKATTLVDVMDSEIKEESIAKQEAELLLELFNNFNKKHQFSLPSLRAVRYFIGARIYYRFYPLCASHDRSKWLIKSLILAPGLIKPSSRRTISQHHS
jgi:glycosyltransferase involved in cell wall biosynthesis